MRNLIVAFLALSILHALPLQAQTLYAENPPEIVKVFGREAPVGTGTLRQLMIRAYEAAFWSPSGAWDSSVPYALSITYFWDIERVDIIERSIQEMARVRPDLPEAKRAAFQANLEKVLTDVLEGDRVTAIYLPGKQPQVAFYHNGKKTGSVAGEAFADAFFAIWFSPNTSEPSLRAKLLSAQ